MWFKYVLIALFAFEALSAIFLKSGDKKQIAVVAADILVILGIIHYWP